MSGFSKDLHRSTKRGLVDLKILMPNDLHRSLLPISLIHNKEDLTEAACRGIIE
jgi:hypothetical protein